MAVVLERARAGRPYLSHQIINGADEYENDQMSHTLRHHFRKLQKQGRDISWLKRYSFDVHDNCHFHLALFHDLPLSVLLSSRRRSETGTVFAPGGNDTADVKTDTQENGNDPSTHPPTRDLGRAADSDTSSIHNAENDNATACHMTAGGHADKRTSPPWMIRPP